MVDWPVWLLVVLAMVLAQVGLWVGARLLGRHLRWPEVLLSWVVVLVLLGPWLSGSRLLVPNGSLARIGQLALPPEVQERLPDGVDPWAVQSDVMLQFLPAEVEVRRAFSAGRLPLWSDRLGGGTSPWANPQAEVFSPTAMIGRLAPLQHHVLLAVVAKLLIAMQGAAALARRLGGRTPSALLAAVGFGLGGGMVAWLLFPLASTAAWIPWHCLAVVGLMRTRRQWGREILRAAFATTVVLLAGHPETGLGGGLLAATLGLAVMRRRRALVRLGAATAAAVLGVALAAPLVLPTLAAVRQSQRFVDKTTMEATGELFHKGGHLLFGAWVNPLAAGRPYGEVFVGRYNWCEGLVPYAGLVALAGLLAALLVGPRVARAAALFSTTTLLAASGWRPLSELLHAVPLVELVTWERVMLAGGLASALAGALAAPRLWLRPRAAAVVALAVAASASLWVDADPWVIGSWVALALALGLATLPRTRPAAMPLVVVVALVDLGAWASPQLPHGRPEWFYPRTAVIDKLEAASRTREPGRVVGEGRALYPHHLAIYGLEDVRGNDPLGRADLGRALGAVFEFAPTAEDYFASFLHVDHPFLDALNVTAILSHQRGRERRGLVWAGVGSGHSVWRNRGVLPRWFIASQVDVVAAGELPDWLRNLDDPRRVAIDPGRTQLPLGGTVTAVRPSGQRRPGIEPLRVEPVAETRLLATSLTWPEGWTARAPGREELETLVVNGAFLGVVVPPGVADLVLEFTPPGLPVGLGVGVVAWLLAAALWWRSR